MPTDAHPRFSTLPAERGPVLERPAVRIAAVTGKPLRMRAAIAPG